MKSHERYYLSHSKINIRQEKKPTLNNLKLTHSQYQLTSGSDYIPDFGPSSTFEKGTQNSQGMKILYPIRSLPKHFITDKEDLYQELLQQKRQANEYLQTIRSLKTNISYLKSELMRLQSNTTPSQIFESDIVAFEETRLTHSQKQLRTLRLYNFQQQDLEKQLLSKDNTIEKLKKQLKFTLLQSQEFENSEVQAVDVLNKDYVEMANLIKQQEDQIKGGQDKLQDYKKNMICLKSKYKGLKNLQQQQQFELTGLKQRDMVYIKQQDDKKQNERILRAQIEQMQMEMNKVNALLTMTQNRLFAADKKSKEAQAQSDDTIQMIDKELIDLRDKFQKFKEEVDMERFYPSQKVVQTIRKRSIQLNNFANLSSSDDIAKNSPIIISSSQGNRQSQLYRINEEHLHSYRSSNRSVHANVKPTDLNFLSKLIKYRLISLEVNLKDIDQYLFTEENIQSNTVHFSDLVVNLQNHKFGITDETHLTCLARYLTDYDEEIPHVSVARARSIFKTLVDNYNLPDVSFVMLILAQEEQKQKVEDVIINTFQKHRYDFMAYVQKKQTNPNLYAGRYLIEDLLESFKAFDAPFNKQHINHLLAYLFTELQDVLYFKQESLSNLFRKESKPKEGQYQIYLEQLEQTEREDTHHLASKQEFLQLDLSLNPFAIDDDDFTSKQPIDEDEQPNPEDVVEFKMVDSQRINRVSQN